MAVLKTITLNKKSGELVT